MNCADAALSVFYPRVSTCWRIFCTYKLSCCSVECCFLLRSPNLEHW